MRRTLIAGNWKMSTSLENASSLLDGLLQGSKDVLTVDWVVCPPFPYLSLVQSRLSDSNIAWGGQNCAIAEKGAYTGEVSCEMLKDFYCDYVIVGHSERRTLYNESSDVVAKKVAMVLAADLNPILCVGETEAERDAGQTEEVVAEQLAAVFDEVKDSEAWQSIVIAYEPVWAIGTGKQATPEQAQAAHAFIRAEVAKHVDGSVAEQIQILYGGSVKPDNAAGLLSQTDIDGALVGGASLDAEQFIQIGKACNN